LRTIAGHPATFLVQTLKAFRANQGMLLAGAVAYYALLSIVPLLILVVIALSHLIDQRVLLDSLTHQLEWLVPGQAKAIVRELANFLAHRAVIGWVLLCTIIFFSSLAFTVLENAMSVIFVHRVAIRRRHFLISALLPYCYSLSLGMGVLLVTLVSSGLQAIGADSIDVFGWHVPLVGASRVLLYLLGVAGEIFVLTSIYLVIPVGRPTFVQARSGRSDRGGLTVGSDSPRTSLVFCNAFSGQRRVWITHNRDRSPLQSRSPGNSPAIWCSVDRGIRTTQRRFE
jgi:uncharacterized BrkB/YihY/UPF0761 family membrane protein